MLHVTKLQRLIKLIKR